MIIELVASIMTNQTQCRLKSLSVTGLRHLKDLSVSFEDKNVTGIFGINGCGKTTLLYILLCLYNQEKYFNFGSFFKKCTPNEFNNVEISADVHYRIKEKEIDKTVIYKKSAGSDRWTPKRSSKPERKVYFFGISSCVPSIETESGAYVTYDFKDDRVFSNNVLGLASKILGIKYTSVSRTTRRKKTYYHATIQDGANYYSVSMGAGEQRVIRLLEILQDVEDYSLFVIDEIEVTLHTAALNRLIVYLIDIGDRKHVQFVFTSHCEALTHRTDINIRHLLQTPEKTLCFDNSTPECLDIMLGDTVRPIEIYVEDDLAEAIVNGIAEELGIKKRVTVKRFGACTNAFVACSGLDMLRKPLDHKLFVLDGDKYVTDDEKEEQFKNVYSGTEPWKIQRRKDLIKYMLQFNLPSGMQPEQYINKVIQMPIADGNIEMKTLAEKIIAPTDFHDYVDGIIEGLGYGREVGLHSVIDELKKHKAEWANYTDLVRQWLSEEMRLLNL